MLSQTTHKSLTFLFSLSFLAYKFFWKQPKQLVKTTSSFPPRKPRGDLETGRGCARIARVVFISCHGCFLFNETYPHLHSCAKRGRRATQDCLGQGSAPMSKENPPSRWRLSIREGRAPARPLHRKIITAPFGTYGAKPGPRIWRPHQKAEPVADALRNVPAISPSAFDWTSSRA